MICDRSIPTFWLCSSPIIPFQVCVALSKLPYFPSSTWRHNRFGCDSQQKWSSHQANSVVEAKNFWDGLHQVHIESLIPAKQQLYVYHTICKICDDNNNNNTKKKRKNNNNKNNNNTMNNNINNSTVNNKKTTPWKINTTTTTTTQWTEAKATTQWTTTTSPWTKATTTMKQSNLVTCHFQSKPRFSPSALRMVCSEANGGIFKNV